MDKLPKFYLSSFLHGENLWLLIFATPHTPMAAIIGQLSGSIEWVYLHKGNLTNSELIAALIIKEG